jgi:hypothetical protein
MLAGPAGSLSLDRRFPFNAAGADADQRKLWDSIRAEPAD